MTYHYTYYSYEEWGMGYFGSRSCECLPEEDVNYLGSFKSKTFNPTQKIILKDDYATRAEAIVDEIILHDYYDVAENPHFANQAKQKTTGFYYSAKGVVRSEEYKKKMSERLKGREIKPEWIAKAVESRKGKFDGEGNPFYGKTHTPETRKRIAESLSQTYKEQGNHPWIGRKHSEESKRKMREAHTGKNSHMYGKSLSDELKEKISESKIGRKWYNNGINQICVKEPPGDGWVLGRIKKSKEA
jgi:hypothetical protein